VRQELPVQRRAEPVDFLSRASLPHVAVDPASQRVPFEENLSSERTGRPGLPFQAGADRGGNESPKGRVPAPRELLLQRKGKHAGAASAPGTGHEGIGPTRAGSGRCAARAGTEEAPGRFPRVGQRFQPRGIRGRRVGAGGATVDARDEVAGQRRVRSREPRLDRFVRPRARAFAHEASKLRVTEGQPAIRAHRAVAGRLGRSPCREQAARRPRRPGASGSRGDFAHAAGARRWDRFEGAKKTTAEHGGSFRKRPRKRNTTLGHSVSQARDRFPELNLVQSGFVLKRL